MFRRLSEPRRPVRIEFEGRPLEAEAGESVAAALLAAGILTWRKGPVAEEMRGAGCLIGHCQECLIGIEGAGVRQACLVPVTDGMRLRQVGGETNGDGALETGCQGGAGSGTRKGRRAGAGRGAPPPGPGPGTGVLPRARRPEPPPGVTDLVIVGAGPAGMAAALEAREAGLQVSVFDEQEGPGGQIYRNVLTNARAHPRVLSVLGPDYARGLPLVEAFLASGIDYRPGTSVWEVRDEGRAGPPGGGEAGILRVGLRTGDGARVVRTRSVLLATGALERATPCPGWTLPGVLGAGAAQSLLKGAGLVPEGPSVLVGNGPLLLLVAWQLARAGAPVRAVWETGPAPSPGLAVRHARGLLRGAGELLQGLGWVQGLRRRGLAPERVEGDLRIEGGERVRGVSALVGGRRREVEADLVLVHEGVVPELHLAAAAGCPVEWDRRGRTLRPAVDAWGQAQVPPPPANPGEAAPGGAPSPLIAVAGDAAGIGGAGAAPERGRLAALELARRLGAIDRETRDRRAAGPRRRLARALALRPFLEALYRLADRAILPWEPSVELCRCERVTAGAIDDALALGCPGPNQLKAFTRAGMGSCQGRLCMNPLHERIALATGHAPERLPPLRIRPPVKPLSVGELARMEGLALPPGETPDHF